MSFISGERDFQGRVDSRCGGTQAFRRLSLQFHPDKNKGDAEATAIFEEIAAAYEVLGEPDARAMYDDFGGGNDEGFETYWEYKQAMKGKKKAEKNFYDGCVACGSRRQTSAGRGLTERQMALAACIRCQSTHRSWCL